MSQSQGGPEFAARFSGDSVMSQEGLEGRQVEDLVPESSLQLPLVDPKTQAYLDSLSDAGFCDIAPGEW